MVGAAGGIDASGAAGLLGARPGRVVRDLFGQRECAGGRPRDRGGAAVAEEAGLSLTHMAMAFSVAHPGVTSTILGPRTMEQLDDLLAGAKTVLDDRTLDRIDEIVLPGTDVGRLEADFNPPAIAQAHLRRRPTAERAAA